LLIAGLVARQDASAIRAFVRSARVPAMVTYKAKGVVPDRDAWFAGVFTNGALEQEIIRDADLLIAVGLDRVELLPRPWTPRQPLIDIVDDIPASLQQLAAEVPPAQWDFDEVQRVIALQRYRLTARSAEASRSEDARSDDTLTPDQVVRHAIMAMPNARVTVDAGAHMFPATLLWPVDEPGGMLISNGLSTMGFAVPAAVGAALIDRARPVVALTGDGGLLMCAGELATLAREQLRVTVIVFNDRSLSLIDVKQRQRNLTREGVALGDVRWTAVADGLGLTAYEARTARELEQALAAAAASGGPTLVDVAVDPTPYDTILRVVRG
jgi:acetolactate synthase-1/2/3 large subunit